MKEKLKKLWFKLCISAVLVSSALATFAFASGSTTQDAMSIINTATADLKSDAAVVIASGLGIAVLFFGAKFLWSKFKGMAK